MAINKIRRSKIAERVAEEAITIWIQRFGNVNGVFDEASAGNDFVLSMIPIYSISAENILAGRWRRGWRSGWRYLLVQGDSAESGLMVDVRRAEYSPGSVPVASRISSGNAAPKLLSKLNQLAIDYWEDKRPLRARLLRLPWIGMEAIWLNSDDPDDDDPFFGLQPNLRGDEFRAEMRRRTLLFQDK